MKILVVSNGVVKLCTGNNSTLSVIAPPDGHSLPEEWNVRAVDGVVFLGNTGIDPLYWVHRWGLNGRVPVAIVAGADELAGIAPRTPEFEGEPGWAHFDALMQRIGNCGQARHISVDQRARELIVEKRRMTCSPMEFRLLIFFLRFPDVAFSRKELLQRVSGARQQLAKPQIVDVLVRRLRKKLELNSAKPVHIHTVRGVGYLFRHNGDLFVDSLTQQSFVSWPVRDTAPEDARTPAAR
jgi:DNA-binding winged helix-turn-helix (wHTH) protein